MGSGLAAGVVARGAEAPVLVVVVVSVLWPAQAATAIKPAGAKAPMGVKKTSAPPPPAR